MFEKGLDGVCLDGRLMDLCSGDFLQGLLNHIFCDGSGSSSTSFVFGNFRHGSQLVLCCHDTVDALGVFEVDGAGK